VADDSPVQLAMLSGMLERAGYEVVRATDGMDAAQRVYNETPDLAVLDIFMPRLNGYQVCRLLKGDPAVAHVPVVILTAFDSGGAEFWSRQTGANAFMVKGFQPPELLAIVERLLAEMPPDFQETPRRAYGPEELLSELS